MKILAIKQPWASLIVTGLKDVENRTWSTNYRGPLIVHASLRGDGIRGAEIEKHFGVRPPTFMPEGGIVGIVDLVDVVKHHQSKWYQRGHYALVLTNPRPLPFVRWSGVQSLQDAPQHLLDQLNL